MAEFGPKVFHALAYMADRDCKNTFLTQTDPAACGFNVTENGLDVCETIEKLKNAIFKTIMLRVRNDLYARKLLGDGENRSVVTLEFNADTFLLHSDDDKSKKDEASLLFGGENKISPALHLDSILDDCLDCVKASWSKTSGVCADDLSKVDAAFKNDKYYDKLKISCSS